MPPASDFCGATTAGAGSRLRGRVYYGIIVAGVVLGAAVCAATGWEYVEIGAARPTGRRIWDGIAEQFVTPICAMVGATFGGLLGVAIAAGLDLTIRRRTSARRDIPPT